MVFFWIRIGINLCTIGLLAWMTYSLVRSTKGGAPYVPLRKKYVHHALQLADAKPGDTLYDLGCGDGRVLAMAVSEFGVRQATGLEIAPVPLAFSRLRLALLGPARDRISIRKQDLRTVDLSDATIVYTYLMPKLMEELGPYFASTMKAGARLVTASFPFPPSANPYFRLLKHEKLNHFSAFLYERI